MRSFLKEIEDKFIELEQDNDIISPQDELSDEDELDEMSTTGGVAGYNTPAAFAASGHWKNKKIGYASGIEESVNKPPSYSYKDERYQKPESSEEEYMDKFPFADSDADWQHNKYEYPSKPLVSKHNYKDEPAHKSVKAEVEYDWSGIKKGRVEEMLESKYEQLIESYKKFTTEDAKISPEQKVKRTIREVAKRLKEIEQLVEYNSRLKRESNIAATHYGPGTQKALSEISNRLIKISERVRTLGE
jgi:hypothetical protein